MNDTSHDAIDQLFESEKLFAKNHGGENGALEILCDLRRTMPTAGLPDGEKIAAWIVAPVMAGFGAWMARIIRDQNALALGVMREGRLLTRLMRDVFGLPAHEADFNRHFTMLAAYDCGDDEALVNWLTRTRVKPLTQRDLSLLLPLYQADDPDAIVDVEMAQKLVTQWRRMGADSPIYPLAKSAHEKIWRHWQERTAENPNRPVVLMDFACAGNIQRSLQTILHHHGDTTPLIGLNFVTTRGTVWAKRQGCDIRGFMAEDGQPEGIANLYARAPEVIEIFAAAPSGPLVDYAPDGQPVRATSLLSTSQQNQIESWQSHILRAAPIFRDVLGARLTPAFCRILWGRLLADPTAAEVMALADFRLDAGLEGSTPRPLAPRLAPRDGDESVWTKMQTGWPAGSALRQRLRL